jgi:hypothetical protein
MSGKIVKGKKVRRKWVESEMIFKLFGMSDSGKKERCVFIKMTKLSLSTIEYYIYYLKYFILFLSIMFIK